MASGTEKYKILQGNIQFNSARMTLGMLVKYDRLMENYDWTSSYAFYKYSEDKTDPDNQTG
jgi:hypothetical protein